MFQYCSKCGMKNKSDAAVCIECRYPLKTGVHSKVVKPLSIELLDGRYKIQKIIKAGAMGSVFKAVDTRLNREVAVKKMTPVGGGGSRERAYAEERFKEEAELLSSLHHGGLPKVSDYFTAEDPAGGEKNYYLVMTFITGKDLETIMQERHHKPLPLDFALNYTVQILDILSYLHSGNPPIIYRDIKPSNIMIITQDGGTKGSEEGRLFLIDFGIARVFMPSHKGTAIGTPGYAAPEQYKGFSEPRSDLYSLGVLMHYLLSGKDPEDPMRPPFQFEDLCGLNPHVPHYLNSLIMSMLDIIPANRPSCAAEILEIINSAGEASSLFSSQNTTKKDEASLSSLASVSTLGSFTNRQLTKSSSHSRSSRYLKPASLSSFSSSKREEEIPPLHEAAGKGRTREVEMLIDMGANINQKDKDGMTPLHRAAMWGFKDTVESLLLRGADPQIRDDYGMTPAEWANSNSHYPVTKLLKRFKLNP